MKVLFSYPASPESVRQGGLRKSVNTLNANEGRMHQSRHNRTETLDFIQSMLGQLRQMAEAERCDMLAYLVEMAYVEASDIIRGERPTRVRSSPTG